MSVAESVLEAPVEEVFDDPAGVAMGEAAEAGPVARFAEAYVASEEEVGVGGAAAAVQISMMTRW